jgi:alpha/beta superfamily hydrolase
MMLLAGFLLGAVVSMAIASTHIEAIQAWLASWFKFLGHKSALAEQRSQMIMTWIETQQYQLTRPMKRLSWKGSRTMLLKA